MRPYARVLLLFCFWEGVFGLSSCSATENNETPRRLDASDVLVLAKMALEGAQGLAIRENVEYCGYITQSPDGALKVAGPEKGSTFGCRTPLVYKPDKIIASFHNHGAFDERVNTEIPSTLDFDSVNIDRVDAYIGTPGGRLWHIDFERGIAQLVCGPENCLPIQSSPPVLPDEISNASTLNRATVEAIEKQSNSNNRR